MIKQTLTITNERGIHIRPVMAINRECDKYACKITVIRNGEKANAKAFLQMVALGIGQGDEITVICDGADEDEAMRVLTGLINSGFHEILTKGG